MSKATNPGKENLAHLLAEVSDYLDREITCSEGTTGISGEEDEEKMKITGEHQEWLEIRALKSLLKRVQSAQEDLTGMAPPFLLSDVTSLSHFFHEFGPSERKALKNAIDAGETDLFLAAFENYVDGWKDAPWSDEEKVERIASWSKIHLEPALVDRMHDLAEKKLQKATTQVEKELWNVLAASLNSTEVPRL